MKKYIGIIIAGVAVAAGSFLGYKVATNDELRGKIVRNAQDVLKLTKKIDTMSEDVAIRTAKLTKNPKVNQDFVEKQWEAIGL
ncbi:Uncharacterised protein [Collinsella sp. AK_207A]|uniref:hypothetical protein n=1 Tax=Collinsella sp. AK_207A TaxID=2650472 RepID=UPI001260981B|nr:hypothetical protein [Collinsella sp. AK_207A]VWL92884.1 Uncharacterised protein [Collinsella sp. AK_207A]